MRITGMRSGRGRTVRAAVLAYALLVLGHMLFQTLAPQRSGVLAMAAVFAPYLWAPLILLLPLSLRFQTRDLVLTLVVCVLAFSARFGSTLLSEPALLRTVQPSASSTVSAMTWNVLARNHQIRDLAEVLTTAPPDIVGLQEITTVESMALAGSELVKQHYPFHILAPHPDQEQLEGVDGMAILTRFPILEHGLFEAPAGIWARLDLGQGQRMVVVNATPMRAEFSLITYDPGARDHQIRRLRTLIDPILQRGEPLLVLGDFNVTQHEPAYKELVAGLQDAHLAVGLGFGSTWRPGRLARLPLALIRIDYLLSSPELMPMSIDVDCSPHRSDHCIVRGEFAFSPS